MEQGKCKHNACLKKINAGLLNFRVQTLSSSPLTRFVCFVSAKQIVMSLSYFIGDILWVSVLYTTVWL